MRVLIAGGGIGGLVAALHLHRVGIEACVFESAEAIRPLGVGINVLPHAVRELTLLGLEHRLTETGVATAELIYCNKLGQRIWREPRGREAGYHWPQYSIHRGRLQMLLLEAVRERLGPERVRTGHSLASFAQRGDRVTATFHDRAGQVVATEEGDVLVGADGIHSHVRRAFYPDEGEPCWSGMLLWRGVSESEPFLTGRSMIMAGHFDQKFVAYPISREALDQGRSLVNWVAELRVGSGTPPGRRDWNRRVDKDRFRPAFSSWRFDWLDVPALIDAAAEAYEFPMVDRDPLPHWSFGRVTMLGDAAHPMYPIGSNGASQAILDAAALTDALASTGNAEQALRDYEQLRLPSTAAIVLSNREMGPERVLKIVEERAPQGFTNVRDVISPEELEEVSQSYKRLAGFHRDTLNERAG